MDFLLYHRSDDKGHLLEQTLQQYAATHSDIHLVTAESQVIAGSLLPCLIVKTGTKVILQLMKPYQMFGGDKMNVDSVSYVLGKYGVGPEVKTEDPRGYPYNADELLNFPMTLQVPSPPPVSEVPREAPTQDTQSLGERIQVMVTRVFDHPIAHHMRA